MITAHYNWFGEYNEKADDKVTSFLGSGNFNTKSFATSRCGFVNLPYAYVSIENI